MVARQLSVRQTDPAGGGRTGLWGSRRAAGAGHACQACPLQPAATCAVARAGALRALRHSTAARLHKLSRKLLAEYGGTVSAIRQHSPTRDDFAQRLLAFEGIGPKTVEIFMREAEAGLYGEQ